VVELLQVHQLVDEDVVANPGRRLNQPPVQADVTAARARAPAPPLIPHADARNGELEAVGQLVQPKGKITFRLLAQGPFLALRRAGGRTRREAIGHQASELPVDPSALSLSECLRLAFRSAPRNRHAHGEVAVDPKHVPFRTWVANEDSSD